MSYIILSLPMLNMNNHGNHPHAFIDEERKTLRHLSIKCHRQILEPDSAPCSPPSWSATPNATMYSLIPPPSPGCPWTLSPLQTPSPSLLYHCIASLHRQEGTIFSIAASTGVAFTGSESRRIRAWRQPDCIERGYVKASYGDVRAMLCYGNLLFTSHRDHKVRIWNFSLLDTFQSKKVASLPKRSSIFLNFAKANRQNQHKDFVTCMAYYHAEGLLYTGSWDKTIKAWRVSEKQCVDSFLAHDDNINSLVVNQDDGCVFSGSSDGSVKIWRRVYGHSSHSLTMTLKFQPSPINALVISTCLTSCFLYSGSSDGYINFWEKESISSRFNHGGFLQGHRFSVLCLVAIEKLILSGSEDTTIRVWRREEGSCYHECLAVLDAHRGPVKCLAATILEVEKVVMGFLVYSSGLDQTFKVWRIKVMPDAKTSSVCSDHSTKESRSSSSSDLKKMKVTDQYEMSPVLSPSWVERKLQGDCHPFH